MIEDLKKRGLILLEQGVLHPKTYECGVVMLEDIQKHFSLKGDETAFVTHLFMCLERTFYGEVLQEESDQMAKELAKYDGYSRAITEFERLQSLANITFTESEKMYLMIHLLNLHPKG